MLIYGKHPVIEAVKTGKKLGKVFVVKDSSAEKLCKKLGINYQYMSRSRMNQMCGDEHQGICAELKEEIVVSARENLKNFLSKEEGILLILYRIQDQRNLGNILRTAYLLEVDNIISTFSHSAKVNATTVKASAGAIFHVNFSYMDAVEKLINDLKRSNVNSFVLERGGKPIEEFKPERKLALLVGSEHYGIPQKILKASAGVISLKQRKGSINSYNVSSATAIALYYLRNFLTLSASPS